MKLAQLTEDTAYNYKVLEWYFCDDNKRPILFGSKQKEIRVRGIMRGGENDGKSITTSPIVAFNNNGGNYIVTTQSGSKYTLTTNDINPKYKSTLQADMISAILAQIGK